MNTLNISPGNAISYEYFAPVRDDGAVFVFFNALTGDINQWENGIAPKLREAGHGTLAYNMRGQANSPFQSGTSLDQRLIVDDAVRLLREIDPPKPVFTGLSIGGLFAANAMLEGASCAGLVLINTLRRDGPRLEWINSAVVRMAEVGGANLMRDIMSPLIMTETWMAANRSDCIAADEKYDPMDQESGTYNLLASARNSDWNIPYESLSVPVLLVTGKHDRVFRDLDDIANLSARIPNATSIEFDDAGHMVPVEAPERLADAMVNFVDNQVAT